MRELFVVCRARVFGGVNNLTVKGGKRVSQPPPKHVTETPGDVFSGLMARAA